jgi:branched-chain amino acid transport system permease protein
VCAAIFAFLIGFPILRLKGFYFCIATAAIAETLKVLLLNTSYEVAGGAKGIYIPAPIAYNIIYYYFGAFVLMLFTVISLLTILNSRFSLAFAAIKDNADGAKVCGINVALYKTIGFTLSAFFTGLAGGFFAYYRLWVDPTSYFNIMISFQLIVISYFGGLGTIEGPLIATPIIIIITEIGRIVLRLQGYLIPLSLIMLLTILLFPEGIAGVLRKKLKTTI